MPDVSVMPALAQWPTGIPTDEEASRPPVCMPEMTGIVPQRLSKDTVVDEEGELVTQDDHA